MVLLSRLLSFERQPRIVRYGVTTALVALAVPIESGLHSMKLQDVSVLLPLIVIASAMFDRGAGFYATLLCTGAIYFDMRTNAGPVNLLRYVLVLCIFVPLGFGVAILCEGLHQEWERVAKVEQQKDVLFRELNHRVKNNLAMAVSLLGLQARRTKKDNPEVKAAFQNAVHRVQTIAHTHNFIFEEKGQDLVEMKDYIQRLCDLLVASFGAEKPITVAVESDPVRLPTDKAVQIGLIVNENVTNAFKYAFPGERGGKIWVKLSASPLTLTIEDDGVGCPNAKEGGLGTQLMQLMADGLGGTLVRESLGKGCCVRLTVGGPKGESLSG